MNLPRRIAFGALFLLPFVFSAAAAQDRDCALLSTLASHDPAALRTLRLGYEPGAGISFWLGRRRAGLAPATECELDADAASPNFDCRWEFRSYADATAFYEPLLAQARRCLGVPFTAGSTENVPSAWMVMRSNEAEISQPGSDDDDDGNALQVEITLIESTHPDHVTYYVSLAVER